LGQVQTGKTYSVALTVRETLPNIAGLRDLSLRSSGSWTKKDTSLRLSPRLHLSDVATISREMPEVQEYFRINGQKAITLDITREPTSNGIILASDIDEIIKKVLPKTYLASL
jgi:multidrug efflux pump subunit AcrB